MKTKKLYIIAIGVFSLLFILVLVVVPFFFFFSYFWTATTIVLVLVVIFLIMYISNMPGHKMHRFYEHDPIIKIKKIHGQRFPYKKPKYPFSCGHATIQMILENYGIVIDQDEILTLSGDKALGMTAEELKETLNMLFDKHILPLRARIQYYTTYSQLFDAMVKKESVIVMFINSFHEPGYPLHSTYPHFGLLNYINLTSRNAEKGKVIITSPMFSKETNPHFVCGKYEGEIMMPVHEFQERFYFAQKYLNRLRYKPILTENVLLNTWNRFLNFLFIFAMYVGYCTKVMKPGLAIFIEPTDGKKEKITA